MLLPCPITDALANGLAVGYNWLYHTLPVVAALIVGGLWQVFVIFGIHWGVTPMNLANFAANGCDTFQAFQTCAVVAQAAACFGVFLKSRSKENKNVALSAGITGIFGITEPAIYGVNLRLKKPFIAGCVGGAVGAVIVALSGTMYYIYAGLPGLLTVVNAIDPSGANSFSLTGELIAVAVTIVITVILIQVIGCGEKPETLPAAEAASVPSGRAGTITICAPMNGEIRPNSAVNDPTFAEGILGQGAAIIPSEGRLYAPIDCTIATIADSKHAYGLVCGNLEMLIHIGLDTVELGGKCFTPRVKVGDAVRAGQLIAEFDLAEIQKKYDTITPVLVTNADDFSAVDLLKPAGSVKAGEPILAVKS